MSGPALERATGPGQERVELPRHGGVVGHDQLRGQAGGTGADVTDQVDERRVLLVADRGDDGRRARGNGPAQSLVREGQQILDAAAAAGEHDHVDFRVRVEPPKRRP